MKDLVVSYDVAVRLKEIGFDEPCMFFYRLNKLKISLNVSKLVSHSGALASSVSSDAILLSNHNLFNNDYSAPTYKQVFEWFRKKGYLPNKLPSNEDFLFQLCDLYEDNE
ncbi:hypothetical protein CGC56_01260 [Capnocytophaga canimorsus]|uniref:Uncharacterized protein n=1 Tax=Capnocytophaga canimorsus TaxID=28188 RepID=A0A250G407_9FLAO|nr:hypothetical protein [Capnocytophaga canimorsus]ATA90917.1 hypothetical protein CGC56_01260 [Capnocytophaga canimorsus]